MATQPAGKPISKGICEFCKSEVAKNKMTQHLKSCKQRLATIAAQEEKSQETKTRLFHILAEGEHYPGYWLHFEVPASEPLWVLDDFLKDMWIDDLDHLSGFTINGTDYSNDEPDDFFFFSGEEAEEEGEDEEGESVKEEEVESSLVEGKNEIKDEKDEESEEDDEQPELSEIIEDTISLFSPGVERLSEPDETMDTALSAWLSEIRKPRSVDELIDYLKEELPKIEQEHKRLRKYYREMPNEEFRRASLTAHYQKIIVESILEDIEDRSLEVPLERVLKVGQKFSYIYDYGSSTYITLKVMAEREGIIQDEEDTVQLLAQNIAPEFACIVCGKPATQVAMGYYYKGSLEDGVYCDTCAETQEEELDGLLPIINSPRVGVL